MIAITYTGEDGEEVTADLPSRKIVCPACKGEGFLLHPSMRGHVYTAEEFAEAFSEEEAAEYTRRGGRYDVPCERCCGNNVVDEVDDECLTAEQREHYDSWCNAQREDAEYEAMCRAERLRGA